MLGKLWNNKQINKKNMMKPKHLIPLTLLAALTALGACISPQDEPADCQDCGQQQIILQVQESGSATTRAGRPLYSSEHKQLVDHVTLVVCYYDNNDQTTKPDNQIAAIKHIDNWMTESTEDPDLGRRCYVSLMGSSRVPEGVATYKVYAIGYTHQTDNADPSKNNETEYTVGTENLETYLKSLRIGQTFPKNLTLGLTAPGEEIFAGTNTEAGGLIQSNEAGGFTTEVVLHRQVAGVYMYVSDIPYPDQARELCLTAACNNDGLVLGQFDSEKYQNGQQDATADKVVNGTNAQEGINNASRATLCTIDLTKWKDGNGAWKNPYDAANKAPSFQEKSYFAGSFVIPFAAPSEPNAQSLQLELWGYDTSKALQTWSVKLPDGDPQYGTFTLHIWDENEQKFTTKEVTERPNAFSLLRNHLYCIGRRDADDGTGNDEPLPLSDANPIILQVVAEWDHVYDMELEPEAP